jgi:hypothetical protein
MTAAALYEHLREAHAQVRITPGEAEDPGFLDALHRVVLDQNLAEAGPACCACCRDFGPAHNRYPCSACGHYGA